MLSQGQEDGFEDGSRASALAGRDEDVDSRRSVNCTQAEVERSSRKPMIPSSGD
jgi:hypothetical protein